MADNRTPMERFDDLLSQVFKAGKARPKAAEANAEEIAEGGVPPTSDEESDG